MPLLKPVSGLNSAPISELEKVVGLGYILGLEGLMSLALSRRGMYVRSRRPSRGGEGVWSLSLLELEKKRDLAPS